MTGSLLVAALSSGVGETYDIQFSRPFEKESKFNYSATGDRSMQMEMLVNGNPMQNQSQSVSGSLESVVTILEVDEDGVPTKQEHVIKSFSGKADDAAVEGISEGTKITVETGEDDVTSYSVDGKPAEAPLDELLDTLIAVSADDSDDDAILGTDEPKAVGDEWQIDADELLESMQKSGMEIEADSVDGKAKVVSKVDTPVGEALEVNAEIKVNLAKGPIPVPMDFEEAQLVVTMAGQLPIDEKAHAPKKTMSMDLALKGTGEPQPGTKMGLSMKMTQNAEVTLTPVK